MLTYTVLLNLLRSREPLRQIITLNTWLPLHFMLQNGSGKPIQQVISF